jgi:hypothetical protein
MRILNTALLMFLSLVIGNIIGFTAGFDYVVKQERDAKAEHDKIMRDIGICDWAKVMAKNIQCQRQLP